MLALLPLAFAGDPMALTVSTTAFAPGETIPLQHTCSGADQSPPITWTGAPPDTTSFAVVVDDPDAPGGTWVHWTTWNLPATTTGLAAGAALGVQGVTSWGSTGWKGPCPPKGSGAHRYFFRVYALDKVLPLTASATRTELDRAMAGHILAQGEVMGKFWRDK